MRKVLGVLGVLVALFSSFMVCAAIGDLAGPGDGKTSTGVLVGLLVFFAGTGFCGVWLARAKLGAGRVDARATARAARSIETRLLGLAKRQDGRVTIPEVALACRIPLDEARERLEAMVLAQEADLLIADDGTSVYAIRGLLRASERRKAQDVLA